MIMIYDSNQPLEEYAELGKGKKKKKVEQCPHCKGKVRLWRHSFYWRKALEEKERVPDTYLPAEM